MEQQAKEPGEAHLTLIQFDTEYEVVHSGLLIAEVPEYELLPRGATAPLDAVGRAINEAEQRLATVAEEERPGLVNFVINTDGLENSSIEFSLETIRKMIETKQKEDGWRFTFLGANQNSFAAAGGMGIRGGGVADFSVDEIQATYSGASAKISRMRAQRRAGEEASNEFTDEEREQMR